MFESIQAMNEEMREHLSCVEEYLVMHEDLQLRMEIDLEYRTVMEAAELINMLATSNNKLPDEAACKYLVGFMQTHDMLSEGEVSPVMVAEGIGSVLKGFWDKIIALVKKIWNFFFGKPESTPSKKVKSKKKQFQIAKGKILEISKDPVKLKKVISILGKGPNKDNPKIDTDKAATANVTV